MIHLHYISAIIPYRKTKNPFISFETKINRSHIRYEKKKLDQTYPNRKVSHISHDKVNVKRESKGALEVSRSQIKICLL